jgi:hypothetical protein
MPYFQPAMSRMTPLPVMLCCVVGTLQVGDGLGILLDDPVAPVGLEGEVSGMAIAGQIQ